MKYFFQLIRYKNLLLLVFMQLIFRYAFLTPHGVILALSDGQYALLILSTICLAAGGYIINDIMDAETDRINRPDKVLIGEKISEQLAYNLYIGCTVVGVVIGFYLSNVIDKSAFSTLFVVIAGSLYIYSTNLKQTLLVGNIIVSLLVAFSVLIIGIFDLLPVTFSENQQTMRVFFGILFDYALVLFFINLIREIVKDIEDQAGDEAQGMRTFPVVVGQRIATKIVACITLFPIIGISYYILAYLSTLYIANTYILVAVLGPLCYFGLKIITAKDKKDFTVLSALLKVVMLLGVISIAVITYDML